MRALRAFVADRSGAAAAELALVLPLFVCVLMGGIWAGLLTLSISSLDYSAQAAARCAAVNAQLCGTTSATETYAESLYNGPAISPVFTASQSGCGHTVAAQASFDFSLIPGIGAVPISASACYP